MKKKIFTALIVALLLATLPSFKGMAKGTVQSEGVGSIVEELYKQLDSGYFDEYTSRESFAEMFGFSSIPDFLRALLRGESSISLASFVNAVLASIRGQLGDLIKLCFQVVALAALCGLISNMSSPVFSDAIRDSTFFAVYLALGTIVIKVCFDSIAECTKVVLELVDFMNVATPAFLVLLAVNGGILTTGVLSPTLLMFTNLTTYIVNSFVLPVMGFSVIMHFVENLLDGIDVSLFTQFIKKGCAFTLGIMFTFFSAVIAFEGVSFGSVDGVTAKAVKYAASNLIPVVGGFLSGSLDTISGFVLVIKNTIGIVGMLIVVSIAASPVISLTMVFFALKASSIIVQPFADKRFSEFVDNAAGCMLFIDMCVLVVGIMFIIIIALFLMAGSYITMLR
ncbi:MAG: stage III sporulation protein AE [Eubacteriaceae bacterium]|nr:stage III sporulation protein AE [Eubacteriaceae bacterium]